MLRDGAKDLENIDKLMDQTKKKLKIVDGKWLKVYVCIQMMVLLLLAQSPRIRMSS